LGSSIFEGLRRLCSAEATEALTSRIAFFFSPFPACAKPQQTLKRENQTLEGQPIKKRFGFSLGVSPFTTALFYLPLLIL
jgi:hypothetical protein